MTITILKTVFWVMTTLVATQLFHGTTLAFGSSGGTVPSLHPVSYHFPCTSLLIW
jgi:hypothetical protein